ncbi:MAG: sugar phosphate isomerase/epimerase family protein [Anaerolineales bacterium]
MTIPVALQLYTLRDSLQHDFAETIERVASVGYAGVETAGFPKTTPEAAARLFADLGLAVCGAHGPLPLGNDRQRVIETMQALNCRRLINAWQPPEKFTTRASVEAVCAALNEANVVAQANGFSLGYHNHWFEFENRFDGVTAHALMARTCDPQVFFEIDVYWVKTAGEDPASVVRDYGARAPLLHIKDGPAVRDAPMTAVGAGVMDIPAVVSATGTHTEWLIVELDQCATNMFTAVEQSYRYLVDSGLGHGKN